MCIAVGAWKKTWLVLYDNGFLSLFDSPSSRQPYEVKVLPGRLGVSLRGDKLTMNDPPRNKTKNTQVLLIAIDGKFTIGVLPTGSIEIIDIAGERILEFNCDTPYESMVWHSVIDKTRIISPISTIIQWKTNFDSSTSKPELNLFKPPNLDERFKLLSDAKNQSSELVVKQASNAMYFSNRPQSSGYYAPRNWSFDVKKQ